MVSKTQIIGKNASFSIATDAVRYIEVMNHTVLYHTNIGTLQFRGSLTKAEQSFPKETFVRSGQSFLVNLRYVRSVHGDIILVGEDTIPLSRARRHDFLKRLAQYQSDHPFTAEEEMVL